MEEKRYRKYWEWVEKVFNFKTSDKVLKHPVFVEEKKRNKNCHFGEDIRTPK
jgi:hypothetical protein